MIGMNFKYFFDKKAVLDAVKKADRKILNETGRMIRRDAQRSLVYKEGPSSPGSPPHAHRSRTRTRTSKRTGKSRTRTVSFLREFLFYQYEPSTRSVVVGPAKLNSTVDSNALPALEEGGVSQVRSGRDGTRSVNIRARPFMRPALSANIGNFRKMWGNSIRS